MASRTAYSTWTPQKPTLSDGHYLRNRSTLNIGVLSYIGIVQHKEHSPEVLSTPPGTPCILYSVSLYRAVNRLRVGQLMLYREIMAVCSEIHTKHINTVCGQNVELLNVKRVVHIVTTVL